MGMHPISLENPYTELNKIEANFNLPFYGNR